MSAKLTINSIYCLLANMLGISFFSKAAFTRRSVWKFEFYHIQLTLTVYAWWMCSPCWKLHGSERCCAVGNIYLFWAKRLVWVFASSSEGSGLDCPLPHNRSGRCDHTGSQGTGGHRNDVFHCAPISQGHSSCSTPAHPDKTAEPISSVSLGCPPHV